MIHRRLLISLVVLLAIPKATYSQGCSDAGFCTMGAMKPDQGFNKQVPIKLRTIEFNAYRGQTTITPLVYVGTLDLTVGIGNKTAMQVKVPFQAVRGNLGETQGLGDISLSVTRTLIDTENGDLNFTIGGKIPSNQSDLKNNDLGFARDYPMYYQVSLGSWDLVAGTSYITRKWLFAAAVQVALTQNNNTFLWSEWPDYPDPNYLMLNEIAYQLHRGVDVMMRVERNFRLSRFNFYVGLLPIWRITQDEIFDVNIQERVKVPETTGLALSLLTGAGYSFNVTSGIKFLYGKELTRRKANPDGLTRENVVTIAYVYHF